MNTITQRSERKAIAGSLEILLEKAGVLRPDDLASALAESKRSGRRLWQVLVSGKKISEERLAEVIAEALKLAVVRLAASPVHEDAIKAVSEELSTKHFCLPMRKDDDPGDEKPARPRRNHLVVAMADPTDLDAIQELEFASGCVVKPVVSTATEIQDAITRHYRPENWLEEFVRNLPGESEVEIVGPEHEPEDEVEGDRELNRAARLAPAVKLVNLILDRALRQKASDIHLEPHVNHVHVRTRVEGLLRDFLQVPKWIQEPLVSRLKVLASLDISERRRPQDGRIKVFFAGGDVDIRISTLPTHLGEKVVMRILGSGQHVPATSSIGLSPEHLKTLLQATSQPQGMILVTGPTGAGKTTTLYSILSEKRSPSINIVSVEDPIEFQLPGISQVQVNTKAGLTFASSLRSILRQDPDVILVGEIRDLETAEIAFRAAATGHLVFSTLHTNGTLATVTRLLDMGVEPYVISSALSLIMAQRLVRKICVHCKTECEVDPSLLERLHLDGRAMRFFHGAGCEACGGTGYAGRTGIFELLRITPDFKHLIHRRASEAEMHKAAAASGTVFLFDAAVEKVKESITSADEVLRVVQLEEEEEVRCPNCGNLIRLDFAVCPYCLASRRRVCSGCRQSLKPEWKLCPYCSTPVIVELTPSSSPPSAASPHRAVSGQTHSSAAHEPVDPRSDLSDSVPSILVVDDDPVVRRMLVRSLQSLPACPRVAEAADGAQGIACLRREKPDLIILDVLMPEMDGFEFCRRLRSQVETAFIPVLMLTASTDEDSRSKGFLVGTDDYMAKPVSVPELHSRVTRLLRRTYGM